MNAENADKKPFCSRFFQKIRVHLRLSASKKQSVGWLEGFYLQNIILQ